MSQEVHAAGDVRISGRSLDSWLLIALFAVLLLTPVTAQIFGASSDGSGENRVLAPLPRFATLKQLRLLSKASEDYVNDHFGLRRQLVHLNSLLRYRLGVSSAKEVVIGRDGWLFYTGDKLLEQHTGLERFTPAELENWVKWMEASRDWFVRRNIPFYILIAPNKVTIYPEKLPEYARPPGVRTRLDQLVERLRSSSLELIDPREALLKAKAEGAMVYFAGDTHWTEHGALVAYSLLMDRVRKKFPDIQPLTLEDFMVSYGAPAASDLAALLALQNDLHYEVERLSPRKPQHQTGSPVVSMRPGWGWAINEIETDLGDRPRLLVYGDSFTSYVLGPYFLYETFRDPVYTFHSGGTFNLDLVNEVKPDIVVVQIAERYLRIPPSRPMGFDSP